MAKQDPRRSFGDTAILQCLGGNYQIRWISNQRENNHHFHRPKISSAQATPCRPPWLSKCLHRAKQTIYWPGLNDQIHELVTNCQKHLKFSNINNKQPQSEQLGQDMPLVPWSKLVTDIFPFENCSCLIVIEYYSRFPVISKLGRMTTKHVMNHMQAIFESMDAHTP